MLFRSDGTKTVEQLAQEKGEEYVVAVVAGNLARYGVKVAKHGGRWVAGKPDDLVKAETEALDRIGKAPNGPDLAGKTPGTVLAQQQQKQLAQVSDLFDKSKSNSTLMIGGKQIQATPPGSKGGSNLSGTAKVFDSQNLTDDDIRKFAQQLAGDAPLKQVAPHVWLANLGNGETVTLRSISNSESITRARWTIDLRGNRGLEQTNPKTSQFELKFR